MASKPKDYQKLYHAQREEHERTWDKLKQAKRELLMATMNYQGAMADNDELVAVIRKHVIAMQQFLELNYPTEYADS